MNDSNKKFFVYAIASKNKNYIYIGLTNDIDRRFHDHNSGYNRTTKPYKPFKLIYTRQFNSRPEARLHEKYLKTSVGRRYLKSLITDSSLPADSNKCNYAKAGPAFGTIKKGSLCFPFLFY